MDGGVEVQVSVCMPTYRRPGQLDSALGAITALEPPPGGFEVVVVDDGSPDSDGIGALVESWAARSPVPVRFVANRENRGPCAAREDAWRRARGEWIAFTDDDCLPRSDWLLQLMSAADDADVVQGRTQPDPTRAHLLSQPFARSVQVDRLNGYYQTCNILYRKSLLDQLDGFDLTFRFSAEDTDLGWRAEAASARITFAPDAVVTHEVVVGDWRRDVRGRKRWADVVHMVAKHPGARRLAWKPYIYRRSHLPVLLYAVAVLLTMTSRTRRLAALAVVVLAARDVAEAKSPRRAIFVAQTRIGDAYEILILLRESIRHRTLLL
jgi:glycosyltransferase involved in cell wall biosynthesis